MDWWRPGWPTIPHVLKTAIEGPGTPSEYINAATTCGIRIRNLAGDKKLTVEREDFVFVNSTPDSHFLHIAHTFFLL